MKYREKRKKMDSLTEDLWSIILARLPVKNINTTCKLVCKQWKSIVESQFFRDFYSSSWSLMFRDYKTEVMASYRWGLERSLGSYISSFLTDKFGNQKDKYRQAHVVAYSDVGLILIRVGSILRNMSFYVANPVSRECVQIVTPPDLLWFLTSYNNPMGIVTRSENGVVLGYKVVVLDFARSSLSLLIYSSETGSWSLHIFRFPFSFICQGFHNSISLNGNLHWFARKNANDHEVVVSIDFYDASSHRCRVTPFPDLEKSPRFKRSCTTSQGNLMYMNIFSKDKDDGSVEHKLSVWRLKSWEWQLVSEISMGFVETGLDYIPLAINPFDATTAYFRSKKHHCLLSINVRNGEFVLHNELERSSNGQVLSSVECPRVMKHILGFHFSSFVLPQWLHRIPR